MAVIKLIGETDVILITNNQTETNKNSRISAVKYLAVELDFEIEPEEITIEAPEETDKSESSTNT